MDERLTLIEASRKAVDTLLQTHETAKLYYQAVQDFGEGELQRGILDMASKAIQDHGLRQEVMASNENTLGFIFGVWVQFLLIEIAGFEEDALLNLAQGFLLDTQGSKFYH